MGVFDKLKFWGKKEDDLGDLGLGKEELGGDPFGGGKDPFAGENPFPDIGSADTQQQAAPQPSYQQNPRASPQGYAQSSPAQQRFQQPQMYGQYEQPDFNRPFSMNAQQPQQQVMQQPMNAYNVSKDIEIISSKLDALRASLDIINQRLTNIERMSEREQVRKKTGW